MRILVFIAFLGWAFSSNAISSKVLFDKLIHAYNNSNYSFNTSYSEFKDGEKSPSITYEGATIRFDGSLYQTQGETELISTTEYNLRVLHENKYISISQKSDGQNAPLDIKSLTFFSEGFDIEEEGNTYKVKVKYLSNSLSHYSEVNFVVDKETFFISELVMYAKRKQSQDSKNLPLSERERVQIVFTNINTSPPNPADKLKLSNYVSNSGGKTIATKKYSDYTVIDHR